MENGESDGVDDSFSGKRGRQYHQVVNHDRAVLAISPAETAGPSPGMANRENSLQ